MIYLHIIVLYQMALLVLKKLCACQRIALHFNGRLASTKPRAGNDYKCKLLIVGGGTGGCSVAWRFSRRLQKNEICVLDGSQYHYYQPIFPLVASGIRPFEASRRLMSTVLPPSVCFVKDYALEFEPSECYVQTMGGSRIYYDFLVVAVGVVNDYEKIPGLKTALDDPCLPVTTAYSEIYCTKTWDILRKARGGHAIFTFPGTDTKCPGAAQKIMYLADDYFRKRKTRSLFNFTYNTGAPHIFDVAKYATALTRVASERHLIVNLCWDLVEVTARCAVFRDPDGATLALPYNLLHATPPTGPPAGLRRSPLAAPSGLLEVDRFTLQHTRYPNVYGLGDCVNTPNNRTAASAGRQSHVVERNLVKTMAGKPATYKYDGYGACVVLTSHRAGIMAESLYGGIPDETFPFDQSKESRLFYFLQRHYFPHLYWSKIIKGKWDGPEGARRILHPLKKAKKHT